MTVRDFRIGTSHWAYTLEWIGATPNGPVCGWLLPLVDEKRQTIADKLMQTYVVTGVEKKAFSVDLWRPPQQTA